MSLSINNSMGIVELIIHIEGEVADMQALRSQLNSTKMVDAIKDEPHLFLVGKLYEAIDQGVRRFLM